MPAMTIETAIVRPELFTEMMRRPLAWLAVALAVSGSIAILIGQRSGRELMAFLGGCGFIAGLLAAASASVFPVMLYSTFDPSHSITAYDGAVSGGGLGIAMVWWPLAMVLSVAYSIVVHRQFSGKVRMGNQPSQ